MRKLLSLREIFPHEVANEESSLAKLESWNAQAPEMEAPFGTVSPYLAQASTGNSSLFGTVTTIFAKDGMRNSDKWFRISVVFMGV
jgi:hypothetical protein